MNISLHRYAVNDFALHLLAKMKVLVVRERDHEDMEFITKVTTIRIVNNI